MSENKISHPDMVRKLFKDPTTIKLSPEQVNLLHAAVGLAGEAGEVLDMVSGNPIDALKDPAGLRSKITNELGDMEFYIEAFCQGFGYPSEGFDTRHDMASTLVADYPAIFISIHASALLDAVKKQLFNNRNDLRDSIKSRLGMIRAHMADLRYKLELTYGETLDANITKLSARYEGLEYSDKAAAARKDEKKAKPGDTKDI